MTAFHCTVSGTTVSGNRLMVTVTIENADSVADAVPLACKLAKAEIDESMWTADEVDIHAVEEGCCELNEADE